jgi:hypothetical protein
MVRKDGQDTHVFLDQQMMPINDGCPNLLTNLL